MTCCWPTYSVPLTTTICLPYHFHTTAINFLFLPFMIMNDYEHLFVPEVFATCKLSTQNIIPILHMVNPCHKLGLNLGIKSFRSLGFP